jgi:hypothetical protein
MRLKTSVKVPDNYRRGDWIRILDEIDRNVNLLAEGKLSANYNATTAAPTTGIYAKGDFLRNSNPSESGSGGSKYIIFGWICTVSGTPGTWNECRFLTGN